MLAIGAHPGLGAPIRSVGAALCIGRYESWSRLWHCSQTPNTIKGANMLKLVSAFLVLSVILAAATDGAPSHHKDHKRKHHQRGRIHVGRLLKELKSLDNASLVKLRHLMAKTHILAMLNGTRKRNKAHLILMSPSRHALRKVHIVGRNPALARLLKEMFGEKKGSIVVKQTLPKATGKRHEHEHKPKASKQKM